MKNLDEILAARRSVRAYRDTPVEDEKLRQVLAAGRIAPSACNNQPWRFAVVTEPALKQRLAEKALGGIAVPNPWAVQAPVIIVACSQTKLLTHSLAERLQGTQFHLIDIGIAMEHMVLKAVELDLGTCYIGWFNAREVRRVLNLPSAWKPECLLTLGYPVEWPKPTPRKPMEEIVIFNSGS